MDKMKLGNLILKYRKQKNLSQEDLAKEIGVTRQTISKWELNETSPDLKQAAKLAGLFEISLDELILKQNIMPEIVRFYGIIIKMFFKPKEHEPSHIHAIYNEYVGLFNIKTFEMFEGDLPSKAQELVTEWLKLHSEELQDMWNKQIIKKLPPL